MLGLGAVLEVTTITAAVAKLALFIFTVIRRNGPAWTAFRYNVFFSMAGAAAASVAIANIDFSGYGWLSVAGVAVAVISISRVGQSASAMVLAFHLVHEFNSPVDAESYTYSNTPGDMVLRLLPGDKYEVDWNIVCADLPAHFDNATVIRWQGGILTVNDTMRNLSWKVKGAELRANVVDAAGVTGMILDPPGPGLYKVAGIER